MISCPEGNFCDRNSGIIHNTDLFENRIAIHCRTELKDLNRPWVVCFSLSLDFISDTKATAGRFASSSTKIKNFPCLVLKLVVVSLASALVFTWHSSNGHTCASVVLAFLLKTRKYLLDSLFKTTL